MIVLGLDPGIARTGFGIIHHQASSLNLIQCGCLTTPAGEELSGRLLTIGQDLTALLGQHRPDYAVIESIFFGRNKKTAVVTAQTRGVLLYILALHHIPATTLTPLQIKSRLTGYGAAAKTQVQHMVATHLGLAKAPEPDDAADALAAALCGTFMQIA